MFLTKRMFPGETPDEGGTPPPGNEGEATPPAPPAVDLSAVMQQMQQLAAAQQQQGQYISQMLEQRTAPQSRQAPESDPDVDLVDPGIKKLLDQHQKMFSQQVEGVQEQQDQLNFQAHANQLGYTEEQRQAGEALYKQWRKNGVRIGDQPPSRIDATRYAIGAQQELEASKARGTLSQAEAQRQAENAAASTIERGGRAPLRGGANPDNMTREQRLEKHWGKVLDEEPW